MSIFWFPVFVFLCTKAKPRHFIYFLYTRIRTWKIVLFSFTWLFSSAYVHVLTCTLLNLSLCVYGILHSTSQVSILLSFISYVDSFLFVFAWGVSLVEVLICANHMHTKVLTSMGARISKILCFCTFLNSSSFSFEAYSNSFISSHFFLANGMNIRKLEPWLEHSAYKISVSLNSAEMKEFKAAIVI